MSAQKSHHLSRPRVPAIGATPRTALSVAMSVIVSLGLSLAGSREARAGDMLRGGAGFNSGGRSTGTPAGGLTPTAVAQKAAQANDTLARTTKAIVAVQAMQAAARQAAASRTGLNGLGLGPTGRPLPSVPNGLAPGGLQVAPGVPLNLKKPTASENPLLWTGANLPTQTVSGGKTTVNINQTSPQAVLTWETFNIGKNTSLIFNQTAGGSNAGKWVAFNTVLDPSANPSQILGSIRSVGQVYLMNQNGIIFGGSSQIDVHTLVASSLPINTNLVNRGLLNNPDAEFLFSSLPITGANGSFSPLFSDPSFTLGESATTYSLDRLVAPGTTAKLSYLPTGATTPVTLNAGANADYTIKVDSQGHATVTFTSAGLTNIAGAPVTVSYYRRSGDVVVQAGANLSSPTTPNHVGGRIALVGPNVSNAGTISTPDGQAILAAGNQVAFAAHDPKQPSLRGVDTFVGTVDSFSGASTNTGLIETPRGNVTMAGKTVEQSGVIDSSTSVSLNGSINLFANYGSVVTSPSKGVFTLSPTETGSITLGANSVTQIVPELDSAETVVGTQLALSSQINLQGKTIHLANDATVFAPDATVSINAGAWVQPTKAAPSVFLNSSGQIYFDSGSLIDVSGSVVSAPVSENIIPVQLLGPELADSPLQRNSFLRGQTVDVDIRQSGFYNGSPWVGTPLGNAFGYVGLIERSVGELTTGGGSVSLTAGGSVVMQSGSKINVSGGAINYEGGTVQTTRLVTGGRLVDIANASPDITYEGFYNSDFTVTHPKYALSETFTNALPLSGAHFEDGYVFGANGGSISITAPAVALDGAMLGKTTAGPRQRSILPTPSSLSILLEKQATVALKASPFAPNIIFQQGGSQAPVAPFGVDSEGDPLALPPQRAGEVVLSPSLLTSAGFGSLTVTSYDGNITIPLGTSLTAPVGGSITLSGANIDVEGKVSAPSGSLSFYAYDISSYSTNPVPVADSTRGIFTLGQTASLNVAGLIVDDRPSSLAPNTLPLSPNGGSVTIAAYTANLTAGSSIDASGGVVFPVSGKPSYGRGGSISISAGADHTTTDHLFTDVLGGKLHLESTLSAFSGSQGGSLTIEAPLVQIGGESLSPDALLLTPDFFNTGGFASFTLTGIGEKAQGKKDTYLPAISIAPGTIISPVETSVIATTNSSEIVSLEQVTLPLGVRSPVSLTFNARGSNIKKLDGTVLDTRGDFVMGAGAAITTDPGGSVAISAGNLNDKIAGTITMFGSIFAPGGNISLSIIGGGGSNYLTSSQPTPQEALATIDIGAHSTLSVAGVPVYTVDPTGRGFNTGTVLPGGSISITGNIIAESGAVMDVSGTSAVLDLLPTYSDLSAPIPTSIMGSLPIATRVDSSAGSITLKGSLELFSNATLIGRAGGPSALGGVLSVSSGRFYLPEVTSKSTDVTLTVTQNDSGLPLGFSSSGGTLVGMKVPGAPNGGGHFSVNTFENGGFDVLNLGGTVEFSGPVSISARREISVASAGILGATSSVTLAAPHVSLGTAYLPPGQLQNNIPNGQPSPTFGAGSLTVEASLIDVGNLSLQGIGHANLIATNGDIRGYGALDIVGTLNLTAGQIYPPTESTFILDALDHTSGTKTIRGEVNIFSSGSRQLPLSAGGALEVYASIINQGGVLRAPIGSITLGWDGSGTAPIDPLSGAHVDVTRQVTLSAGSITSVSAVDPLTGQGLVIPYGVNQNGTSWIDPSGKDITASGVPAKTITIAGLKIKDEAGSTVDLTGGGDLLAYRFVAGTTGDADLLGTTSAPWSTTTPYSTSALVFYKGQTWIARQANTNQTPGLSTAWAQLPQSFAIIPGYQSGYAPLAGYNSSLTSTATFPNAFLSNSQISDYGYIASGNQLAVGQQIYLAASPGLAAGSYTLLPARYALLPGAFLVTPQSGLAPVGTQTLPIGANLVAGYQFSGLSQPTAQPLVSRFEVESQTVLQDRAEYSLVTGNAFLTQGALVNNQPVPRLPIDAGQLVFSAGGALSIKGIVLADAPTGGLGGLVDISSPENIVIQSSGKPAPAGSVVLDAADLSQFGEDSLLIGGIRHFGAGGITVTVNTGNITVDNAGTPLTGPDLILVANGGITLAKGSDIEASGSLSGPAETLHINDSIQLSLGASGSDTFTVTHGGGAISFPSGTPGNDQIIPSVNGTLTLANGTTSALVAGQLVSVPAGAVVTLSAAGTITLAGGGTGGPVPITVGDGSLVRVTSSSSAPTIRSGVVGSAAPNLVIANGAAIKGQSVILDSTYGTSLSPGASISAQNLSLNSGQITIALNGAGSLPSTTGLVLQNSTLQSIQATASSLSLLSYSSIDIYGTGVIGSSSLNSLTISAAEIRGFANDGGSDVFAAQNIQLNNLANGESPGAIAPAAGKLSFNAQNIRLGSHTLAIDQFSEVDINVPGGVVFSGNGALSTQENLTISTSAITGSQGASQTITAGGQLVIQSPSGQVASVASGGLGASLTLIGASVAENSNIVLPSGSVTIHATGSETSDGITIGGMVNTGGTSKSFYDLIGYTSGGQVSLLSDHGSIDVTGSLNVSAPSGGGNGGNLSIGTPSGTFTIGEKAKLIGGGGAGGLDGSFNLDAGSIDGGSLSTLSTILAKGGFTQSVTLRDRADTTVTVDGTVQAHSFTLSTDLGSIDVSGTIDASGVTGGSINLAAYGSITLESGSKLTVLATDGFNHAGRGGAVSLEAGVYEGNGVNAAASVNIDQGSQIVLSVQKTPPGAKQPTNLASDPAQGLYTGTLEIRAPQTSSHTEVQVSAIQGDIVDASSVVVSGVFVQDASTSGTAAIDSFETAALANANKFMANASSIQTRLIGDASPLALVFHVRPGEEIDNSGGSLVLNKVWDLSTWRFGAKKDSTDVFGDDITVGIEPGDLTLRAKGSITFNGTLTDGFGDGRGNVPNLQGSKAYWVEQLLPTFADGTSQQSWSYRITAGADLHASNVLDVLPLSSLASGTGSVLLGVNGGLNVTTGGASDGVSLLSTHYQVIRTGTGDISIAAGRDVQLLNAFATIYTAGTQVGDSTANGTFDVPYVGFDTLGNPYADAAGNFELAQFSQAGGNVSIFAQGNITHLTVNKAGAVVADSERELPNNWLYRRGTVDDFNGVPSTTAWWIDFSNFFEGVGALGGGNVTMTAGQNVSNVDAAIPTTERVARDGTVLELGGGDLTVRAGNNIDAGVYYVEHGQGNLIAGNEITTNSTRSPSLLGIVNLDATHTPSPTAYLPTTLFAGDASFSVSAGGNLLLGPVANPFLLPYAIGNSNDGGNYYPAYFSTFAPSDVISVSSLTGSVTLRERAFILPGVSTSNAMLDGWIQRVLNYDSVAGNDTVGAFQPWLRLGVSISLGRFAFPDAVSPSTFRVTAFSGDITLGGSLLMSPSPTGTIELAAGGSINGVAPAGNTTLSNVTSITWINSAIDVSDADPASIPGPLNPAGFDVDTYTNLISTLFTESGSFTGATFGVLQEKQALHGRSLLHAGDTEPVRLYANSGSISGLTLFAPKASRVLAGTDITDVAFYIQNDQTSDISVVSAGRDIVLYDPNSPSRVAAQSPGNAFANAIAGATGSSVGDVQISGPGTIEILAGRNLQSGIGPNGSDGTGVGLTSVGNSRNPNLPFTGADIIAGAGVSSVAGSLDTDKLPFSAFIDTFLNSSAGARYLSELAVTDPSLVPASGSLDIKSLSPAQLDIVGLEVFYLALRDAGRDHNDPTSPTFQTYAGGDAAIQALFGATTQGNLDFTSREVKTENGGNISLLAPGGSLTVGVDLGSNQPVDQGILTTSGGNISIFTKEDVAVGTSRIFTLRGGDIMIWSSLGNIAAGASAKTVQSAPPTRVIVDPQSGDVETDLAGLATGGGIGVLDTVVGVPPGNVDLIAPTGVVDAGDAGIRATGNLSIAAVAVLNAANIQVGGSTTGVSSAPPPAAPNLAAAAAGNNAVGATTNAATTVTNQKPEPATVEEPPSIIEVGVIGYGGGEGDDNAQ